MRRFLTAAITAILTLGWLTFGASPAHADSNDWRITTYKVAATVDASGTTSVQLDLSFDFGSEAGHGPYLTFPERQEIADDPDHWRMLDYTVGEVSSPSGANVAVTTESTDGNLLLRVGTEGYTYTGVQTYRITYKVRGLIASKQAQSGLDEFNWNAVGSGWEVPIDAATVTVSGPAAISRTACFIDESGGCENTSSGTQASFSATGVGDGRTMQVVAGFPAGTFTGADARLTKRLTIANMFPLTPWTGGVAALLTALGVTALVRRTRRHARDRVFLGLTPGVAPAPGQEASIGYADGDSPVAVAFQPPPGTRPGEVGTLIDATADNSDVTATIVDLAVRGHLRIEQLGDDEWSFTALRGADSLVGYEQELLGRLFGGGNPVTTSDLRTPAYAGLLSESRGNLYQRITTELRWYTRNPSHVRALAVVAAIGLIVLSAGVGFLLGLVGWGLVGLSGVIVGLTLLALNNRFGARTAQGSAVLAQAKGFELYLTTAEADQIRFEEGIDVFSRYLPWAMVFGVADRWTRLFEQLAAEGRYTPSASWYVGYGYGWGFGAGGFASSMDRLASTMSSSMQAATAATSGGSGFSGGGGFGGGGGGGW